MTGLSAHLRPWEPIRPESVEYTLDGQDSLPFPINDLLHVPEPDFSLLNDPHGSFGLPRQHDSIALPDLPDSFGLNIDASATQSALWTHDPWDPMRQPMVPISTTQAEVLLEQPRKRKAHSSFAPSPFLESSTKPFKNWEGGFDLHMPAAYDPVISEDNLEERIPTFHEAFTTRTNQRVTFNPMIRKHEVKTDKLVLTLKFDCQNKGCQSQYFWDALHPNVITTGAPCGGRQETEAGQEEPMQRRRRVLGSEDCMSSTGENNVDFIIVKEVWVIAKNSKDRLRHSWKSEGEFLGNSSIHMPYSSGSMWSFDICCRITGLDEKPLWMKALNKRVFELPNKGPLIVLRR